MSGRTCWYLRCINSHCGSRWLVPGIFSVRFAGCGLIAGIGWFGCFFLDRQQRMRPINNVGHYGLSARRPIFMTAATDGSMDTLNENVVGS